jgi:rubredoxin
MTNEFVKCSHCGYRYSTNIEQTVEDGEAVAVRLGFSDIKNIFRRNVAEKLFIDLTCPNCKKEFEYEVKT